MRVDDFLSTVGVIKRRTIAKELGDAGLILINDLKVKPSRDVHIADRIFIKGKHQLELEVVEIPRGNVTKAQRSNYFRMISGNMTDDDE